MNTNGYIIDNEVIFLPSEKTIRSKESNKTQTLHAPAVRCLQLLIESKTTVPQAHIYKAGWGEDALKKVSTATYYQCFVNLRKQLREIGYNRELLITVPKEGMKINDAIEITSFISPAENREAIKTKPLVSTAKRMRLSRLLIAVSVLAGVGSLVFILVLPHRDENHITLGGINYQRYQELPECVYVHSEQPVGIDIEYYTNQFILTKNLSCKPQEKIFIHQGKIRTTVFRCPENMNCQSLTYLNIPS